MEYRWKIKSSSKRKLLWENFIRTQKRDGPTILNPGTFDDQIFVRPQERADKIFFGQVIPKDIPATYSDDKKAIVRNKMAQMLAIIRVSSKQLTLGNNRSVRWNLYKYMDVVSCLCQRLCSGGNCKFVYRELLVVKTNSIRAKWWILSYWWFKEKSLYILQALTCTSIINAFKTYTTGTIALGRST